jgi:hypothetical protein
LIRPEDQKKMVSQIQATVSELELKRRLVVAITLLEMERARISPPKPKIVAAAEKIPESGAGEDFIKTMRVAKGLVGKPLHGKFEEITRQVAAEIPKLFSAVENALRHYPIDLMGKESYAQRVVAANHRLFQNVGAPAGLPPIYVLPMDQVVEGVLLETLNRPSSPESRLLFDQDARNAVLEAVHGRLAPWTRLGQGTQFFWGVTPEGKKIHLRCEDGALKGAAKSCAGQIVVDIPLQSDPICAALRDGVGTGAEHFRLVPDTFLRHFVLMHHGLTPAAETDQSRFQTQWMNALSTLPESFSVLQLPAAEHVGRHLVDFRVPQHLAGAVDVQRWIAGDGKTALAELVAGFDSLTMQWLFDNLGPSSHD